MPKLPPFIRDLGPVLAITGAAGWWVISTNSGQDVRIASVETKLTSLATTLEGIERRNVEASSELRIGVRRIDDKVTQMLMQGYRPAADAHR